MEFSVKSFAVVSFLLLVSLSPGDMSGPLVVDAQYVCIPTFCQQYCSAQGLPWCCPGVGMRPCRCTEACPRSVTTEITDEVTAGAIDEEERFIKETVIA